MAKKDDINTVEESGGSKLVTALIAIVIILIWLVVFAFLIKLDVGKIGSNVLYPVLKDVPVVNKILPTPSEDVQNMEGNYEYTTLKSANARIRELENQLASANDITSSNSDYVKQLEAKVGELQRYKDDQDAFNQRVKAFDEKVVFNDKAPEIDEYRTYYEEISPENAEEIYRQVLDALQYSENAKTLANQYAAMEPDKAAERMSAMTEDLDLLVDILKNMPEKTAAAILQEMEVEFAAQLTKKIANVDD